VAFFIEPAGMPDVAARELWLVPQSRVADWLIERDTLSRKWLEATGFRAERQQLALIPAPDGSVLKSVDQIDVWHTAGLPEKLLGTGGALPWKLSTELPPAAATAAALGWAYGTYRFEAYKRAPGLAADRARLIAPVGADIDHVTRTARATAMARDFINMPACDMTPARLAREAMELASRNGATAREIKGDELLQEFPTVFAVGQAASCAPRLVDFCWGDPAHPKVTIIGKGVCFDSGGLDIKPAAGMLLMKKDMGGAACALALARLVMESELPVRLRVLIPAVENAIAGNAYRPGDVIRTRKGLTVEIGNTDAEGRLVLCDAIAAADDEQPDLMIDLATLTGAARVALGPDLPAVFGSQQQTVDALLRQGIRVADPLWHMPLWHGYEDDIASKVADLNNASASAFAGAIIGALFLRRFVTQTTDWLHVDLFAWNPKERPGRPVGAEPHAVRALHALLMERYGA
jgi:leucyl aminopeptidase